MKRILLGVGLATLTSQTWGIQCLVENPDLSTHVVELRENVAPPLTADSVCRKYGYKGEAPYSTFKGSAPVDAKNSTSKWISSLTEKSEKCNPDSPYNQNSFFRSLKDISGKLTCDQFKSDPDVQTKAPTPPVNAQTKVSQCVCLSKNSSPSPLDEKLENEIYAKISSHINEEYIGKLAPARLYQFSLEDNILDKNKIKSCSGLTENSNVQTLISKRLGNLSPVAKKLFTKMSQKDALELYNLSRQTSEDLSAVPVVSGPSFERFANTWGASIGSADFSSIKKQLCSLTEAQSEQFSVDLNLLSKVNLTETASETIASVVNKGNKLEEAYLEKMLCAPFGKTGQLLIDKIVNRMKQDEKAPYTKTHLFKTVFKDIVAEELSSQCSKTQDQFESIAKGNLSSILNDGDLLNKLLASSSFDKNQVQRYHCGLMQRQLQNSPDDFLATFCDHQVGGSLPPKSCPDISDFMSAQFVSMKSGEVTADKLLVKMNDKKTSDEALNKHLKKVRLKHATTFTGAIRAAKNFTGPVIGGQVNVSLDQETLKNNVSYNSSSSHLGNGSVISNASSLNNSFPPTTNAAGLKPGEYATSAAFSQNSNVTAVEGFNAGVNIQPNTASGFNANNVSPIYENKTTTVTTAPKGTPSPVVATTVLEKTVSSNSPSDLKAETATEKEKKEEKGTVSKSKTDNRKTSSPLSTLSKVSSTPASAPSAPRAVSFQEASRNPSLIPEDSIRHFVQARKFEQAIVPKRDAFDTNSKGLNDPIPPETGLILNAFKTGKIGNKSVTQVLVGDEIKDIKAFEQSNTFHGAVVIVEDKKKKERYICRALVSDYTDGSEKLLPIDAGAPGKDELAGYKCTTEKKAEEKSSLPTLVEKKEAQKALTSSERLYKAFVLDRIIKDSGAK